ncbi:hypothetical protein Golob_020034 [Gossypium lobatum]|uniref:DUF4283 domain-containing protein n=1 Tax=Gossypium lobatum TaxID=34289 RepID=A0A7J8L9G6_9ROSI|nr:hypothetical protein [Gossypium lobatum]
MEDELAGLNIKDGEEKDALSLPIDPGVQKWGLDLDLGVKRFLFKFFNGMDVDRVVQGSPWTLNNQLLIIRCLEKDEDPLQINRGLKGYLRIRVEIDVKNPLKRRKRITL